ncbi:MAG: tetratricopeptide repeat protein, partial [Pseudomonas sp.]|nr:tetratricopeptide repeat protein [Pseudomonas sp.]
MSAEALEKMLTKGMDNALLRFGLGKAHLDGGNAVQAAEHLQRCVEFDPGYSAAWKLLGK